ncbi:DUF2200 domain-containing protein [Enterococcus sp. HY326]|uniref:DUF2200 domain-containing protein n=1 Tax=Enterococcus sp. HY326 TaxID=2971265 RepID=UPI00223F0E79|nr:DUF2200 domain-containing protein [Enterococcus sp. HY326]
MATPKIYQMSFASVYPLYVKKVERKERTVAELQEILQWLTGYTPAQLQEQIQRETTFTEFFAEAPELNPDRHLIKGLICGVRVEDIQEPLMQEIRYLDKMVDELAKGKKMEKILR